MVFQEFLFNYNYTNDYNIVWSSEIFDLNKDLLLHVNSYKTLKNVHTKPDKTFYNFLPFSSISCWETNFLFCSLEAGLKHILLKIETVNDW